jgi:hypothetical protein
MSSLFSAISNGFNLVLGPFLGTSKKRKKRSREEIDPGESGTDENEAGAADEKELRAKRRRVGIRPPPRRTQVVGLRNRSNETNNSFGDPRAVIGLATENKESSHTKKGAEKVGESKPTENILTIERDALQEPRKSGKATRVTFSPTTTEYSQVPLAEHQEESTPVHPEVDSPSSSEQMVTENNLVQDSLFRSPEATYSVWGNNSAEENKYSQEYNKYEALGRKRTAQDPPRWGYGYNSGANLEYNSPTGHLGSIDPSQYHRLTDVRYPVHLGEASYSFEDEAYRDHLLQKEYAVDTAGLVGFVEPHRSVYDDDAYDSTYYEFANMLASSRSPSHRSKHRSSTTGLQQQWEKIVQPTVSFPRYEGHQAPEDHPFAGVNISSPSRSITSPASLRKPSVRLLSPRETGFYGEGRAGTAGAHTLHSPENQMEYDMATIHEQRHQARSIMEEQSRKSRESLLLLRRKAREVEHAAATPKSLPSSFERRPLPESRKVSLSKIHRKEDQVSILNQRMGRADEGSSLKKQSIDSVSTAPMFAFAARTASSKPQKITSVPVSYGNFEEHVSMKPSGVCDTGEEAKNASNLLNAEMSKPLFSFSAISRTREKAGGSKTAAGALSNGNGSPVDKSASHVSIKDASNLRPIFKHIETAKRGWAGPGSAPLGELPINDADKTRIEIAWDETLDGDEYVIDPTVHGRGTNMKQNACLRKNFRSLQANKWLSDEVINSLVKVFNNSSTPENNVASAHWWSSYFFPKMCGGYKEVKTWIKFVQGKNLFDKEFMFVPWNKNGNHWVLIVAHLTDQKIYYCDSMVDMYCESEHWKPFESEVRTSIRRVAEYIDAVAADKNVVLDAPAVNWEVIIPTEGVPQQKNGVDCGVFMCITGRGIQFRQTPLAHSQRDIEYYRMLIAAVLLNPGVYAKDSLQ